MQGGRKSGAKAKGKREGEEREKGGPQGDKANGAQDHPAPERSQAHGNAGSVTNAATVAAVASFCRELDAKPVGLVRSPLLGEDPDAGVLTFFRRRVLPASILGDYALVTPGKNNATSRPPHRTKGERPMRGLIAGAIVLALIAFVTGAATAESSADAAKKQLQTAMFHAGELAQRGNVAATSLMHLQHVMNCLDGPGGKNFRSAVGNPCQGQGGGAIVDLKAAVEAGANGAARAARHTRAAHDMTANVLGYVKGGAAFTEVDAIQPWAKQIAAQIKLAEDPRR